MLNLMLRTSSSIYRWTLLGSTIEIVKKTHDSKKVMGFSLGDNENISKNSY